MAGQVPWYPEELWVLGDWASGRKRDYAEVYVQAGGTGKEGQSTLHPGANIIQAFGGHGGHGGCRWGRQLAWRSQRKRQGQVGTWERARTAGSFLASEQGKEGESLQG